MMTRTRFFTPGWTPDDADRHGVAMAGMILYVANARAHGLSDDEIAEDLEDQFPGVMPGGCAVRVDAAGVTWIVGAAFIRGAEVH